MRKNENCRKQISYTAVNLDFYCGLKIRVSVVRFRPEPPKYEKAHPQRWAFYFYVPDVALLWHHSATIEANRWPQNQSKRECTEHEFFMAAPMAFTHQ
jgi:hypothetical protein